MIEWIYMCVSKWPRIRAATTAHHCSIIDNNISCCETTTTVACPNCGSKANETPNFFDKQFNFSCYIVSVCAKEWETIIIMEWMRRRERELQRTPETTCQNGNKLQYPVFANGGESHSCTQNVKLKTFSLVLEELTLGVENNFQNGGICALRHSKLRCSINNSLDAAEFHDCGWKIEKKDFNAGWRISLGLTHYLRASWKLSRSCCAFLLWTKYFFSRRLISILETIFFCFAGMKKNFIY